MIVKKDPCFNSANSAPAEIHLFSVFPHCGKKNVKGRHDKVLKGRIKNHKRRHKKLSGTTSLWDAVPDRGAFLLKDICNKLFTAICSNFRLKTLCIQLG